MTNLSRFCSFAAALLLLMVMTGCATFRVDSPKPSDPAAAVNGWTRNTQDRIVIIVVFSSPVDRNTVVVGKTLILKTTKDPSAAGTPAWSPDNKTLTFTTTKVWGDLLLPQPDAFFTLTLIGTDKGQGAIKNVGGTALDGDYDGNPGGDYQMGFTLIG